MKSLGDDNDNDYASAYGNGDGGGEEYGYGDQNDTGVQGYNSYDDTTDFGTDRRKVSVYCDLCFEAHDTNDCPEAEAIEGRNEKKTKKRNVPEARPYCDNCEEFGHDTNDCDAEEEF